MGETNSNQNHYVTEIFKAGAHLSLMASLVW